ncbi:MAG TPA: AI-2E family transporter, partial [Thermoanaerobaculia bacterium]|nr:AI-2E family transporter [Thermoanaerobaculia bacterium]
LAVFFAYLVAPLVRMVRRSIFAPGRRFAIPLPLAIGGIYAAIFGCLTVAVILLLPILNREIAELAKETPGYLTRAEDQWRVWQAGYQIRVLPGQVREAVEGVMHRGVAAGETYVTGDLLPRIGGWLTYLPWLVLVPILAFFLLKDARVLRDLALRILPRGRFRSRGVVFLGELNETLAAYIRAQVTACLLVGGACTIGFVVIGVPYAVVLGIAAGLLEFIPLAGPLAVGVVAAGFAAFHSLGQVFAVVIFLVVLRIVQDYVVYPKIVGRGIHLNPLAVVLAILCGAELGGLTGIFLAIPAVAVLTVTYRHYRKHQAAEALRAPA